MEECLTTKEILNPGILDRENLANNFPLFKKAIEIQSQKGEDYNAGSVTFEDYFIFGHKSYVQMIYMKALRLVSLVEKEDEANFEGIDDTLMDLCVYANKYAKDRLEGKV